MLMRFIWSCQVLLCQQCFGSSVRCEGSLGTGQFRSKRTSNWLRCWYSWSGCCSWWSRWYCVCRFSRWTWTFYCTISTSRISTEEPFPFQHSLLYYFPCSFLTLPCQAVPTTQKNKITLQNSLMHDTDKQYFDVRQPYEDGICKKNRTAWHIHSYDVQTKQKDFQENRSNAS